MEKNATKQWPESTVNPIGHLLDYEKKKVCYCQMS